jgi:hypothetical protein
MNEKELSEGVQTTARISVSTAKALTRQRVRLSAMVGREVSNDDVIRAMHEVFVQQPEAVIVEVVQP